MKRTKCSLNTGLYKIAMNIIYSLNHCKLNYEAKNVSIRIASA